MDEDKSDKGFRVLDRRISREELEGKPEEKGGTCAAPQELKKNAADSSAAPPPPPFAPAGAEPSPPRSRPAVPPITFVSFLLSLHTSALIHLGLAPDPADQQKHADLELARQNIDLLEVIQEKTRGNLSDEETRLLENILYELRMLYIQVCEAKTGGPCAQ